MPEHAGSGGRFVNWGSRWGSIQSTEHSIQEDIVDERDHLDVTLCNRDVNTTLLTTVTRDMMTRGGTLMVPVEDTNVLEHC